MSTLERRTHGPARYPEDINIHHHKTGEVLAIIGNVHSLSKINFPSLGITSLQGADLRGFDLSHANLSKVDMRGIIIDEKTNFKHADLHGTDLSDVEDLEIAQINKKDVDGAILHPRIFQFVMPDSG